MERPIEQSISKQDWTHGLGVTDVRFKLSYADSLLRSGDLLGHTKILSDVSYVKPTQFYTTSGLQAELIDTGILLVKAPRSSRPPKKIALSALIHPNEAGPAEMLNEEIKKVFRGQTSLEEDVLFMLGNPHGITAGTRYIDTDLNREFVEDQHNKTLENARAHRLMECTKSFFSEYHQGALHLDLHTTNRHSKYSHFAIIQNASPDFVGTLLYSALLHCQLPAIVVKNTPSSVFSYFSSCLPNVQAATVELGVARPLGQNDLAEYSAVAATISSLLQGEELVQSLSNPVIFTPTRNVIAKTNHCSFVGSKEIINFGEYPVGTLLFRDGKNNIYARANSNTVLFPFKRTRKGDLAGVLMGKVEDQRV